MLKRGKQNAKLGDKVTVKMWKGMTMYSLSLEERATCPSDCEQWDNCYGDNMPFAHRFDHHDHNFIGYLEMQLDQLNDKHPNGFVVRLHVLGDFYDGLYITQWQLWLHKFENLRIFGYTHHKADSQLGNMINNVNRIYPNRFRIRFSDDQTTPFNASVVNTIEEALAKPGIVCPEQSKFTDSCATCGYCWTSKDPVIFYEH